MSNGDRWHLPDGRPALEVGRTARLLRVVPILSVPPFMGEPVLVWRAACTLQPSRYLRGALPVQPDDAHPLTSAPPALPAPHG